MNDRTVGMDQISTVGLRQEVAGPAVPKIMEAEVGMDLVSEVGLRLGWIVFRLPVRVDVIRMDQISTVGLRQPPVGEFVPVDSAESEWTRSARVGLRPGRLQRLVSALPRVESEWTRSVWVELRR